MLPSERKKGYLFLIGVWDPFQLRTIYLKWQALYLHKENQVFLVFFFLPFSFKVMRIHRITLLHHSIVRNPKYHDWSELCLSLPKAEAPPTHEITSQGSRMTFITAGLQKIF